MDSPDFDSRRFKTPSRGATRIFHPIQYGTRKTKENQGIRESGNQGENLKRENWIGEGGKIQKLIPRSGKTKTGSGTGE